MDQQDKKRKRKQKNITGLQYWQNGSDKKVHDVPSEADAPDNFMHIHKTLNLNPKPIFRSIFVS
jgi:hypothetical protein